MTLTNDQKISLDLNKLGEVIKIARDFQNMDKYELEKYKECTLDKWSSEVKKEKQQIAIEDKGDLQVAIRSITDRYEDLKGKRELAE